MMKTLRDTIITFMKGCNGGVATLKQIYAAIDKSEYVSNSNTVHDSARAIIYRHPAEFKRVLKGVYLYTGENRKILLIMTLFHIPLMILKQTCRLNLLPTGNTSQR